MIISALSHLLPLNTDLQSADLLSSITPAGRNEVKTKSSIDASFQICIPSLWHKPGRKSPNARWGQEGFIWIPRPAFPSIKHLPARNKSTYTATAWLKGWISMFEEHLEPFDKNINHIAAGYQSAPLLPPSGCLKYQNSPWITYLYPLKYHKL